MLFSKRFQRLGMVLVVVYALGAWGTINPLYRGLGPLEDEPIVSVMREERETNPDVRVAVFSDGTDVGSTQLSALVTSSGADTFSATTSIRIPN